MSRAQFRDTVMLRGVSDLLKVPSAAQVAVYDVGTTTPIVDTLYADQSSATTLPNPMTAQPDGVVTFWTATERQMDLVVTCSGYADTRTTVTTDSVMGGAPGVPAGGTSGQVLTKHSALDFDSSWLPPPPSGAINVRSYGALGDGMANDCQAFRDADAAAVAMPGATVLVPPGTYRISCNLTLHHIEFVPGATLSIDAGFTVTFAGLVTARPTPIFTGAGLVYFGVPAGGSTPFLLLDTYPQWWGAVGNGVADDTAALQRCFTQIRNFTRVSFPAGTRYKITATLTTTDQKGVVYTGLAATGAYADQTTAAVGFNWNGPAGGTMWRANGAAECHWERLAFFLDAGGAATAANYALDLEPGTAVISTSNFIADCIFEIQSNNANARMVNVGSTGANNEHHKLYRCRFVNTAGASPPVIGQGTGLFLWANGQTKVIVVRDCQFSGFTTALDLNQGEVEIDGILFNANFVDFGVGPTSGGVSVAHCRSENGLHFFGMHVWAGDTAYGSRFGKVTTLLVRNCTFAWPLPAAVPSGIFTFDADAVGHLTVMNCAWDSQASSNMNCYGGVGSSYPYLVAMNNQYPTTTAAIVGKQVFRGGFTAFNDSDAGDGGVYRVLVIGPAHSTGAYPYASPGIWVQQYDGTYRQLIGEFYGENNKQTLGDPSVAMNVKAAGLQLQGAITQFSGTGVPAAGTGSNGDIYWRADTPATANQRLYVKSAGAWVGIL